MLLTKSQQTAKIVEVTNGPWVPLRELRDGQATVPACPAWHICISRHRSRGFRFSSAMQEEVFPSFCASISSSHMFLSKMSPLVLQGTAGH